MTLRLANLTVRHDDDGATAVDVTITDNLRPDLLIADTLAFGVPLHPRAAASLGNDFAHRLIRALEPALGTWGAAEGKRMSDNPDDRLYQAIEDAEARRAADEAGGEQ